MEPYSIKILDSFLQTIPSYDPPSSLPKKIVPDLKILVEHGPLDDVSIYDGYLHPYPEYEEEVELCHEGRKMWEEIELLNRMNTRGIKVLLLNLQLKDDSMRELTEISSMNKVRFDLIPYSNLNIQIFYGK